MLAVVVMGATGAACARPVIDGGRLVVAGDSITALEQPYLSAVVPDRWRLDYLFRFGISIGPAADLLRSDIAEHGTPGALVVNLGTNDALSGPRAVGASAGPAPLDPVLDLAHRVPCVVLTTVSQRLDAASHGDVAARIDAQIAAASAADPRRVKVVDWDGFLRSLQANAVATYLQRDGIHETEAGARWLADADVRALAACGSPLPPVPPPG